MSLEFGEECTSAVMKEVRLALFRLNRHSEESVYSLSRHLTLVKDLKGRFLSLSVKVKVTPAIDRPSELKASDYYRAVLCGHRGNRSVLASQNLTVDNTTNFLHTSSMRLEVAVANRSDRNN